MPVACTMNPVTVGASAPPRYPPKFWMEPKDAVQWAGAATEARAHDMPLAPPAKKTAAEMAITATTLLGLGGKPTGRTWTRKRRMNSLALSAIVVHNDFGMSSGFQAEIAVNQEMPIVFVTFEWDEEKRLKNLEERGVDFRDAALIFEGPAIAKEDTRENYGEQRIRAVGQIDDEYYVVAYTWRGPILRIISAFKVGGKPTGRTWTMKRRMNSLALSAIVFGRLPLR